MMVDSRKKIAKKLIRHLKHSHALRQFFRNFNEWRSTDGQSKNLHEFINTIRPCDWIYRTFSWGINRAVYRNIEWHVIHDRWNVIVKNKNDSIKLRFKSKRKIYDTKEERS